MALTKVTLIQDGVITADHLHANHGITTDNIGEGTNQFYTDARVASYLSANNYQTAAAGYFTGVTNDTVGQTLTFSKSNATTEVVSLAQYIDDTNLARLTSGTVDAATGIATFTRDDATTFTVDFSSLLDDTNDYVSSASFNALDGVLTLSRLGGGTVTVDLDGRYLTSETDSQTLSWADATNTLSISNGNSIVITGFADASHSHTFASLTSKPTTIAGYGITDAITTVNIGSQSVSYASTAGSASTASSSTDADRLLRSDNRTISPSEYGSGRLNFGFTSFNNNSTAPWADFIHMRGYTDPSGGSDNMLVFSKSSLAARLYQQTYGSTTAYTNYVDFITSGNIGSQSVSYASNAGTLDGLDSSAFFRENENRKLKVLRFTGEGTDSGNGSLPTSYGIYQQGGAWSSPFPDLCIGFHTGIKIGAHYNYNGTRFYNNSDWVTEIFSVGNGDNHVRVANNLYASGSVQTPIFYDSNNTGTYVNPNGASNLDNTGNTDLYLGGVDSDRTYNGDAHRDGLTINGGAYPHIDVNGRGGTNTTHGPVISMTSDLTAGGFRRWGMGIASTNPNELSFGYYDNQPNPHYGIGINWGSPAKMWIDTGGNLFSTGSMRSPIFYDSNNTGYYVDPASTSNFNAVNASSFNGDGSGVTNVNASSINGISSSRIIYGDGGIGSSSQSSMDLTSGQKSGFFFYDNPTGNPFGDWTHWINVMGNSWSTHYGYQLAHAFHSDNFAVRRVTNGSWGSWRTIVDSSNVGSYAAPVGGSYGTDWYANAVYYDDWLRNHSNTNGLYWSTTGWHLHPYNSNDFTMRSGSGSESTIRFANSGNTTWGYIHNDANKTIGFLNYNRNWVSYTDVNGNHYSTGSSRAPIFYDSDNTSYYVDAAGTSNLGGLNINGDKVVTAGLSINSVGSVLLCGRYDGNNVYSSFGTVSGNSIYPASADGAIDSSVSLSGTWRARGYEYNGYGGTTLYQRIY